MQRLLTLFCLLGVCLFAFADRDIENSGSSDRRSRVQVQGHSGSFTILRSNSTRGKDRQGVRVKLDSLYELDADGNKIGNTGAAADKHSRETFANTDFDLSDLFDYNDGSVVGRGLNFSVNLVGSSRLRVQTILLNNSGNVGENNETFNVVEGNLKFNVEISDWPFCDSAGSGVTKCANNNPPTGEFLELAILVRNLDANKASKGKNGNKTVELGDNAQLYLAQKIRIDGQVQDLPAGYPKFESANNGDTTVTIRFPKFTKSAFYDPVVALADDSASSSASHVAAFGAVFLALVSAFLL